MSVSTRSIRWTEFTPLAPLDELAAPWGGWPLPLPSDLRDASIAVLSGDTVIHEAGRDARERLALRDLIRRFAEYGLSWTGERSEKISRATEATAQRFLKALPPNKALPKISPDGEGGLMMVWEASADDLLLTVDEVRLHAVVAATTPHASYLSDITFNGTDIPQVVLAAIPER